MRVSGTVTYRERIALPPGAVVAVSLEDTSLADAASRVVVRRTITPDGQIPIPFALDFDGAAIDPRHAYGVRAQIRGADGRLLWTSTSAQPVFVRGHSSQVTVLVQQVPSPVASTPGLQYYHCDDGVTFSVRSGGTSVQVLLGDRTVTLPQVPAGDGVKFTDGANLFWTKGQVSLLEVDDKAHHGCRSRPAGAVWEEARLRGVDFRAVGNEPGWYLELRHGGQMLLVTDYGERRLTAPTPAPQVVATGGASMYRTQVDDHDLVVTIQEAPCTDDMNGEAYPSRVQVLLGAQELRGCGRALH